jgi:hypothetical protein
LLLSEHRYGLIDYPALQLAKSGVFAAYAAHGCVVLNTAPAAAAGDGLEPGRHYLALGSAAGAHEAHATAAAGTALHRWYAGHALRRQAADFLTLLGAAPV